MGKEYKFIGIIPARKGSKGLRDKNIRELDGHPLISYSIASSLNSKLIERTIVSTNCENIKSIAEKYGAEVPFLRPDEISGDLSLDLEFLSHALDYFNNVENAEVENFVLLRPTSPLRTKSLIDDSIAKFLAHPEADSLRTVCLAEKTPYKMWTLNGDYIQNLMDPTNKSELYNKPRQSLPEIWFQAGALDIIPSRVIKSGSVSGNKILPFKISNDDFCDIDDEHDLLTAKKSLKSNKYIIPEKY